MYQHEAGSHECLFAEPGLCGVPVLELAYPRVESGVGQCRVIGHIFAWRRHASAGSDVVDHKTILCYCNTVFFTTWSQA
jgi:hypothetical protein